MIFPSFFKESEIKKSLSHKEPWNKGKLIGQRPPLRKEDIWTIRTRLKLNNRTRDIAMFNLAIDSKLRACDLVSILVKDVYNGREILKRSKVMQKKTTSPVQFEITPKTRKSLLDWILKKKLSTNNYLFPSSIKAGYPITTRQYSRIVKGWVVLAGLDPKIYATHTMRRTKATLIYKQNKNLRAVQILLGHKKIESTVRYLGVEIDDALTMAEEIEV
ncbi:MAG: tyrosine-type recombinase/integrase [Cyclobacteriaceae bacterium]|nr:tyrosine-type recombinase/integrase [Cyclobacteriaceae bacterium]